jgi:hypothetical protein
MSFQDSAWMIRRVGAPAGGGGVTTPISRILARSGDDLLRQRSCKPNGLQRSGGICDHADSNRAGRRTAS